MTIEREDQPQALPIRVALLSIAGFWAFYFLIVSIRAMMLEFDDQFALFGRRVIVVCISAGITYIFYLILRRQPIASIKRCILIAALLAIPASIAFSAINYFAFREFDAKMQAVEAARKVVIINGSESSGSSVRVIRPDGQVEIRSDPSREEPAAPPQPPAPPTPPVPPAPSLADNVYVEVGDVKANHEKKSAFVMIADQSANSYFFFAAWAALYLALCYAGETRFLERRAARLRAAAQAAELKALRYQVNPHFLFNTLNSLSSLIMTAKPAEAEKMIINLSNFFRTSLAADPTEDVTLEEEIHLQRLYLDIEAVRFPGRLKTEIAISEGLESVCVPALILQPLVENAIKYGVSRAKEPVTIRIHAREDSRGLVLSVENDAPGHASDREMPDPQGGAPGAEQPNGMGVGLRNVRDRLAARFGDAAECRWGALAHGGFGVIIFMPIVRNVC